MLLRIEAKYAANIRDVQFFFVKTHVSDMSDETEGTAWDMDINGEGQDKHRCRERASYIFASYIVIFGIDLGMIFDRVG